MEARTMTALEALLISPMWYENIKICPICRHPKHEGICGGHKVVIDGDLYDSGESCPCDGWYAFLNDNTPGEEK